MCTLSDAYLVLADVKYSLNDLEKHYKTFCGVNVKT